MGLCFARRGGKQCETSCFFKENRYLFLLLRYFLPAVKQRAGDEGAGHVGWKPTPQREVVETCCCIQSPKLGDRLQVLSTCKGCKQKSGNCNHAALPVLLSGRGAAARAGAAWELLPCGFWGTKTQMSGPAVSRLVAGEDVPVLGWPRAGLRGGRGASCFVQLPPSSVHEQAHAGGLFSPPTFL